MTDRVSSNPLAVVALGGNALLRRGEPATAANQLRAARAAAQVLGPVSERTRLVVTHGNGTQVGLLALEEDACGDGDPYPPDVLDTETEGQIGYEQRAHALAIGSLVDAGFLVVCVGGGGVPVIADGNGQAGVEAVIDKDLASALLAIGLGADVLALATDVDAVYTDWGTPNARPVTRTTPTWLRAQSFDGGSMAPKVEAVCRFVEATGKRAAIGRLEDISALIDGTAGTQIAVEHARELARLHEVEDRNLFAMRKIEDRMGAQERDLASELRMLGERVARAEVSIEREWRREHFGLDPERTPAWREHR